MKIEKTVAAVFAATFLAGLGALPARADHTNTKCNNDWNAAMIMEQIGQKCGYLDAAASARLKTAEASLLQCAAKGANAAQLNSMAQRRTAAQADSTKRVSSMQCGADTKQAFDRTLARLPK
jgi:hypothetical protein